MSDSIEYFRKELKEVSRESLAALREVSGELQESKIAQAKIATELKQVKMDREKDKKELRSEIEKALKEMKEKREEDLKEMKDKREKDLKEMKEEREKDRALLTRLNEEVITMRAHNKGSDKTSADFWTKFFQWTGLIGLVLGVISGLVFGLIQVIQAASK